MQSASRAANVRTETPNGGLLISRHFEPPEVLECKQELPVGPNGIALLPNGFDPWLPSERWPTIEPEANEAQAAHDENHDAWPNRKPSASQQLNASADESTLSTPPASLASVELGGVGAVDDDDYDEHDRADAGDAGRKNRQQQQLVKMIQEGKTISQIHKILYSKARGSKAALRRINELGGEYDLSNSQSMEQFWTAFFRCLRLRGCQALGVFWGHLIPRPESGTQPANMKTLGIDDIIPELIDILISVEDPVSLPRPFTSGVSEAAFNVLLEVLVLQRKVRDLCQDCRSEENFKFGCRTWLLRGADIKLPSVRTCHCASKAGGEQQIQRLHEGQNAGANDAVGSIAKSVTCQWWGGRNKEDVSKEIQWNPATTLIMIKRELAAGFTFTVPADALWCPSRLFERLDPPIRKAIFTDSLKKVAPQDEEVWMRTTGRLRGVSTSWQLVDAWVAYAEKWSLPLAQVARELPGVPDDQKKRIDDFFRVIEIRKAHPGRAIRIKVPPSYFREGNVAPLELLAEPSTLTVESDMGGEVRERLRPAAEHMSCDDLACGEPAYERNAAPPEPSAETLIRAVGPSLNGRVRKRIRLESGDMADDDLSWSEHACVAFSKVLSVLKTGSGGHDPADHRAAPALKLLMIERTPWLLHLHECGMITAHGVTSTTVHNLDRSILAELDSKAEDELDIRPSIQGNVGSSMVHLMCVAVHLASGKSVPTLLEQAIWGPALQVLFRRCGYEADLNYRGIRLPNICWNKSYVSAEDLQEIEFWFPEARRKLAKGIDPILCCLKEAGLDDDALGDVRSHLWKIYNID